MPNRRIIWLSKTVDESVHDKKICDNQPIRFPLGIILWQDTEFQRYTPNGVTVKMPTKKLKEK
ncbi:MAG TPA: hypothetical protein VIL99_14480 [Ignavibacteria bacterium]